MKLSKNKLNDLIETYIADVESYDTPENLLLTEATLHPLKQLILESKQNIIDLKEITQKSKNQDVIDDFMLYIRNI